MITRGEIVTAQYATYRLTDGEMGYIYILRDEDNVFKIGATLNLIGRFDRLYKKYKFNWGVECVIPSSNVWIVERKLHWQYKAKRVKYRKDWFYLTPEDIEYIKGVVK